MEVILNVEFIKSSEDYLRSTNNKYDVIYLDTGNEAPVEDTALLQLIEANVIVERELLNKNGPVIIDDQFEINAQSCRRNKQFN